MFTHQINGDESLLNSLKKISDVSMKSDITADIASYLLSSTDQRFDDEVGPDGSKWAQSHRARKQGGKTLSNKGFLRDSFTTSSSPKHAAIGTNHISAAIHQHGGIIRPKNKDALYFRIGGHLIKAKQVVMPARPMVGLSNDDHKEIPQIVLDHWEGAFVQ